MVFRQDFKLCCEVCLIKFELFLFKRLSTISTKKELNISDTFRGFVTNSEPV
jgi:hypothetical protein